MEGATFHEVEERRSEAVTRKESDWPMRTALDCQFCPQFLLILTQSVFDPFTLTPLISPAPATLVTRTRLKYLNPFTVNLIPPIFRQGTLQRKQKFRQLLTTRQVRLRLREREVDLWVTVSMCPAWFPEKIIGNTIKIFVFKLFIKRKKQKIIIIESDVFSF